MKQLDDLNRRPGNTLKGSSNENDRPGFAGPSHEQSLDEIGGEPLVGSGFENEEPENDFCAGEES